MDIDVKYERGFLSRARRYKDPFVISKDLLTNVRQRVLVDNFKERVEISS